MGSIWLKINPELHYTSSRTFYSIYKARERKLEKARSVLAVIVNNKFILHYQDEDEDDAGDESQTLLIPSLTPATSICTATTNQKWESTHAELIKRDYEIQGITKKK
nr:14664_t:CDS:2 [Entrophospora candida]